MNKGKLYLKCDDHLSAALKKIQKAYEVHLQFDTLNRWIGRSYTVKSIAHAYGNVVRWRSIFNVAYVKLLL